MGVLLGISHLAVPSRTECSGSILPLVSMSLLIGQEDGAWTRAPFFWRVAHVFLTSSTHDSQKMFIFCANGFPYGSQRPLDPFPAWQKHGSTLCGQSSQNTGWPWVDRP